MRELVFMRPHTEMFGAVVMGAIGTIMYVHALPHCQNVSDAIMLRECPHLSIPTSPIIEELRGFRSDRPAAICMAFALPLPLISDWACILNTLTRKSSCTAVANRNANSNAGNRVQSRQEEEDIEQQQETALSIVPPLAI